MTNIARQHRERILARQAAEAAAGGSSPLPAAAEGAPDAINRPDAATQEARLMLARLTADRARLKDIQSGESKISAKADMLPEYQAWLDGLIAAADSLPEGEPNDVLFYCMVWHIDTGDISRALDLASVVLARKIAVPPRFERTAGCLVAEEVAEAAFAALRKDLKFNSNTLDAAINITADEDMPDEVRAKLFKARAMIFERDLDAMVDGANHDGTAGAYEAALVASQLDAQRALELHSACGVKKLAEKLARLRKKIDADKAKAVEAGASS